jgi:hypothetical protein
MSYGWYAAQDKITLSHQYVLHKSLIFKSFQCIFPFRQFDMTAMKRSEIVYLLFT